jgi:hypothetical protein
VLHLETERRTLLVLVRRKVRVYDANPEREDLTIWVILRLGWEDFEEPVRRCPEVGIRVMDLLSVRLG